VEAFPFNLEIWGKGRGRERIF